jgi:hypothetical protein
MYAKVQKFRRLGASAADHSGNRDDQEHACYIVDLIAQTRINQYQFISFLSSVVERGIAAMQVILRSMFRIREGAVLLSILSLQAAGQNFYCTCALQSLLGSPRGT